MSQNRNDTTNTPESFANASQYQSTPRLNQNQLINNYFTPENNEVTSSGYLDSNKSNRNIRLLSINPHGCNPFNPIKMHMLKQAIQQFQLDVILMNEVNTKWTSINVSKIEQEISQIDRSPTIITADSHQWETTPKDYLPGGIMNIILSKCYPILNKSKITKGRLGNWTAFSFQNEQKRLEIITLYRIPSTSSNGVCCSLTQYNRIDGKMNTTTTYRKEIFQEIQDYIRKNPEINDIIIAGDYNQYIGDPQVRKFHENIEVHELHPVFNNVPFHQIGRTYKHGSRTIDSIAATPGVIDYVDGCKLLDYNEIVESDHKAYVIDIALEDYFHVEISDWDNINKVMLNPARRSHREQFIETLEQQLNLYMLENDLDRLEESGINHEMEVLDELITNILRTATKAVEGMKRNVPYSQEKEKRRSFVLYCKMKLRQLKGIAIDNELMESKRKRAQVNVSITSVEEAKEMLQTAKEQWNEVVQNGKEMREKELMDYHTKEIIEEDEKAVKKKQKVLAGIRRKLKRNHTFHYISRHAGKGLRQKLRHLHLPDEEGNIQTTIVKREEIEEKIADYNEKHLKKAHGSIAYKDKIYHQLRNNSIRDKILNGTLRRDECDDERVYQLLKLLHQNGKDHYNRNQKIITGNDWVKVVKKSKRRSASSIFSRRTYAVYKCALDSERMMDIFVRYYNLLVKNGYYPKRWLDILDSMLGKGKGFVLGKLRIITLIEADWQYVMRMFLDDGDEEIIEDDSRFSKSNYGSRKNYSIETALLEKRLILDHSLLTCNLTIYCLTDLQSCYDRQLPNIGGIIEESAGRDRNAMKLITKVMPNLKHYVCTGFGISSSYYGGEENNLAGTGQGNRFSGDLCRDTSCLIIKEIEKQQLGMNINSNVTNETVQKAAVSYVDDNDYVTDGEDAKRKMNQILKICDDLHTATGGNLQEEKSKFFAYKWGWRSGIKHIKDVQIEIEVNGKKLAQEKCKDSEKTLGVMMSPSLSWEKQFCMMVGKMKDAVRKLNNTEMITTTASMYYNAYLITNVYYGSGVFSITKTQEEVLKKIYEPTILRKLKLSTKFPRKILYARKSALGVGLMAPSTIVDTLAVRAYVGHQRGRSRVSKLFQILEQKAWLQYGYSTPVMETSHQLKPKLVTWSDEIQYKLEKRQIKLINRFNEMKRFTTNKTIMDYASDYVKREDAIDGEREAINHVRLYKKMILPFEVVGFRGEQQTKEFRNASDKSSVIWNVSFEEVPKPHKRLLEIWMKFLQWLKMQQINTIIDFKKKMSTKYQVSNDLNYVKIIHEDEERFYEKGIERYGQQIYKQREAISDISWRYSVAEMNANGSFQIHSLFPPCQSFIDQQEYTIPFSEELTESIRQGNAIAASDTSVKEKCMGGCWIIAQSNRKVTFLKSKLYHNQWNDNTSGIAEVLTLLDLISVIETRGKHIQQGKIKIAFDNRVGYRKIVNNILKFNEYAKEAGGEIAVIKEKLQNIKFDVELSLERGHSEVTGRYQTNPLKYLLKECDKTSREMQETARERQIKTNLKFYGSYSLVYDGNIIARSVQETLRIVDARSSEEAYHKEKLGYRYNFVDYEARDVFKVKDITPSIIKCTYGYNHYGLRDALLNNNMVEERCPRCNSIETWDHVVKCTSTIEIRRNFIQTLLGKLLKNKPESVEVNEIMAYCEDILRYLEDDVEDEDEYETTQRYVGMQEIFRGYIVKNWMGANINCTKYYVLNKVLVYECVMFYNKCWKHRNEVAQDETKQRERLIKWYENERNEARNSKYNQVRLYVQRCVLDVNRCNCDSIKRWILNLKNIEKKVEKIPQNDIRQFLIV